MSGKNKTVVLTSEQHNLLGLALKDLLDFNLKHKDEWEDPKAWSSNQSKIKRLVKRVETS